MTTFEELKSDRFGVMSYTPYNTGMDVGVITLDGVVLHGVSDAFGLVGLCGIADFLNKMDDEALTAIRKCFETK